MSDPKIRLAKLVSALAEYYGKPLSDIVVRMYLSALEQYPIEQLEAAAQQHMADPDRGRFMPKVADFVAAMEGDSEESAALAWDQLIRGRDPFNRDVNEIDAAATSAIKSMGGWSVAIGQRNSADMPFVYKDFLVRYKAFKRRESQEKSLLNLGNVLSITQGGKR